MLRLFIYSLYERHSTEYNKQISFSVYARAWSRTRGPSFGLEMGWAQAGPGLCYGPRLGFMLGRGPFSALLHIIADGQDYDNVGGGGGCFVRSGSVSLAMCAGNCLRTLCARFAFFLEFMHANRSLFFYLHFVVLETTVAFFFFFGV